MAVTHEDVTAAAQRLRGRVRRTPLIESHALRSVLGRRIWLKLESLQHTRSFKYRGALNALLSRDAADAGRPLVAASAGNHGLALATAAHELGMALRVFVPCSVPAAKLDRMRLPGIEVDVESRDYDEAEARALEDAARDGGEYVSPYNHPAVIAGAGTVGLEILDELPGAATIVVPTGGGGLVSGIALAANGVRVIGVEPALNPSFTTSLAAGRIETITPGPSLADGLLGNLEPGSPTFDLVRRHTGGIRAVNEDCVSRGVRELFLAERVAAEGAGAIGVGALVGGTLDDLPDPLVIVVSGANIDVATFIGAVGG